ncbi:hypothetical protein [Modestobacter marinus]|uniref:hypothetical protein n=1 Tax=Modestobacter marinus TaxID=477641 RepID=UPI001C9696FD|nr:hypothetical protein [Modestobacter marinus]
MSSLVHLGRAAISRAQLAAPREREAVRGTLIPADEPEHRRHLAGLAADGERDDRRPRPTTRPMGRG